LRTARHWIAPAGSDPPEGSVIAKKVCQAFLIAGTAYFWICSSVPAQMTGGSTPEHACAWVVQAHPMLRHLFHQHAYVESAKPAAAVFLWHAHTPHPGGLGFARQRPELAFGNLGRIGIDTVFNRDDFVADDPLHLIAQRGQLFRQHEAFIAVLHQR